MEGMHCRVLENLDHVHSVFHILVLYKRRVFETVPPLM